MNDPTNQPIDIEEMRQWLITHKQTTGLSWSELAKRTGVAAGTISQFGSERGYAGDETRVAETIYRYRQHLPRNSKSRQGAEAPGYFDTETSKYLAYMLNYAQGGRIAVAALGAGLGKTTTAEHYAACYPNVFLSTMTPSTAGVNNMQIEILEALGERDAVGTPQKLTRRIKERLKDRNALLIIDEAQHLRKRRSRKSGAGTTAPGWASPCSATRACSSALAAAAAAPSMPSFSAASACAWCARCRLRPTWTRCAMPGRSLPTTSARSCAASARCRAACAAPRS
jgi:hypothetical protein